MTPTEEQILRNQVAILGMLSTMLMSLPSKRAMLPVQISHLETAERVLSETSILLNTEHQQGRTAHAYTP